MQWVDMRSNAVRHSCFKAWLPSACVVHLLYSLSCLCLKIINGSCGLFLMEEREQNKLCHLFMGDLRDGSEKKKAGKNIKYSFLIFVRKCTCAVVSSS